MNEPDDHFGSSLRQLFLDASEEIRPTRPAPVPPASEPGFSWQQSILPDHRPSRRRPFAPRFLVISFAALILVAAVALTISVRHSSGGPAGSGGSIPGSVLAVRPNGALDLINPNTGAVTGILVGPSPIGRGGKHLSEPLGVTAAGGIVYVSYEGPEPAIYSVPLAGGALSFVTDGIEPQVSGMVRCLHSCS